MLARPWPGRRRRVAAPSLVALIVLLCSGCGGGLQATGQESCNGSPELCSRPLNDAFFAGTDNSFASSDEPGWYFANQTYPIPRQLRDGIRAFLIDIHYGVRDPANGRVRTDLAAEGSDRNKVAEQLPASALRVADRVAGGIGLGAPNGIPRAVSLSHPLRAGGRAPGAGTGCEIASFPEGTTRGRCWL